MTNVQALPVVDAVTQSMGIDNERMLYGALLATHAARVMGLPLPIRTQTDDTKVVLFFARSTHLDRWATYVNAPVDRLRLVTGRFVPVVDVVLHQVPFRLVCSEPLS